MWLIAFASTGSALWILTANAWMQHPVGYTIRNGRAELTDFVASMSPDYNLTAHNASSSPYTLKIMLVLTIIFVPIVIAYQIWTYNLFKGKVTEEDLEYDQAY